MDDRTKVLVAAARFAVKNSGDHGCEWCKSRAYGCKQCEAWDKLTAALEVMDGKVQKVDGKAVSIVLPSDGSIPAGWLRKELGL